MGVNVYADGGVETFEGSEGWVQIEVWYTNTTKLKGGRAHRFCVNRPSGHVCKKVVLVALWVPCDEVPSLVMLS